MYKNVLFIGDSCIDNSYYGDTCSPSPESNKINIFKELSRTTTRGMVFNTYENFRNLELKNRRNYNARLISNSKDNSPIKNRFYNEFGEMIFRHDYNDTIENIDFDKIKLNLDNINFVVVSDYDKGFLNYDDIAYIANYCVDQNIPCLIDTKKILTYHFNNYTFIKLNESEFNKNEEMINKHTFLPKIICTLSDKGCKHQDINHPIPYKAPEKVYPEGCGDTFVAGFVYEYLTSNDITKSIKYGMEMAGLVVERQGVVLPYD